MNTRTSRPARPAFDTAKALDAIRRFENAWNEVRRIEQAAREHGA